MFFTKCLTKFCSHIYNYSFVYIILHVSGNRREDERINSERTLLVSSMYTILELFFLMSFPNLPQFRRIFLALFIHIKIFCCILLTKHKYTFNFIFTHFWTNLLADVYYYYYYLVCEAIGTAATPGLLCQPRMIMKMMIVEK
jgi:hypothetical protein